MRQAFTYRPSRKRATNGRTRLWAVLVVVATIVAGGLSQMAFAATAGPNDAGTGVTVAGGGVAWTNPGNITTAGTPYATTGNVAAGGSTNQLRATNYSLGIPAGATINGITVTINRQSSGMTAPFLRDLTVQLTKTGGTLVGSNLAATGTDWPTAGLATATYGGTGNLWGTTWTAAEVNASTFGVVLQATNAGANNRTATVDYIRVTVTYTAGDTTNPTTASVTAPVNGTVYRATTVPVPAGQVADNTGGAGLAANSAYFTLRRPTDNWYWTGSAWQSAVATLTTTHIATTGDTSATWTNSATMPTWTSATEGVYTAQATARDTAGNSFTGTAITFTLDRTAPTVTVNQAGGQADPTNVATISYAVVFSESVTGVATTDFAVTGTATGFHVDSVTGSGTTYTVTVHGGTGSGTVILTMAAGGASDAAGNTNAASTSTDNTVTFDNVAPTVTVNQAGGQADPTNVATISYAVVFSESVTGVATTDFAVTGTATGFHVDSVTGSGTTYTVTVHGGTGSGTVILTMAAGGASDAAGNTNAASTSTDNTVTFDNVAPTVTVNQAGGQADPTNVASIQFAVVFSESVTGLTTGDFSVGGTAGGWTVTGLSGSGDTYTATVTGTNNGTVTLSLPADSASDAAGNTNAASTSTDNTVTCDNEAPTVTISTPSTDEIVTPNVLVISGTASDSSSVTSVAVTIQRSGDSLYWTGSGWGAQTWLGVSGTTTWSGSFTITPQYQNGSPSYTIAARAVDPATNTGSATPVTGVTIHNLKDVTVTAIASNKPYDGDALATVEMTSTDFVAGDAVTIDYTSATFDDKNVGDGKMVSVSGISLSGADASRYNLLNTTASTTADITAAGLTITADDQTKLYGLTFSFAGTEFTHSAMAPGDDVTSVSLFSTGAASGAVVGDYAIVASAASGTGLSNYSIGYTDGTLQVQVHNHTLTYAAGLGGSITGDSPQTVAYNGDGTEVVAVADTGYHFVRWSDGVDTAARTDTAVIADLNVDAEFAIDTFQLKYAVGTGSGSLSGTTSQTVDYNTSGSAVTANAGTGYHFEDWSDGSTVNPRTDTDVTADLSVTANFAINTYTLTYAAGSDGSISGTSPQTVDYGGSGTLVLAVPDVGHVFVHWSDGVTTADRTDVSVDADIDVTAEFAIDTHTLRYIAGTGGSIEGSRTQVLDYGLDGTEVTATASAGYYFVKWSDDVFTTDRTDTNVTSDKTLTAQFAPNIPGGPLQVFGPAPKSAPKGATIALPFTLRNMTETTMTLTLSSSCSAGWLNALVGGAAQVLPPNTSVVRIVNVTVPGGATGGAVVVLSASGDGTAEASATLTVPTPSRLGEPKLPWIVRRGRAFEVYGAMWPAHKARTRWIILRFERWTSKGWVFASNVKTYNYSKAAGSPTNHYGVRTRLWTRGKYRVKAYHPADAGGTAEWSIYNWFYVR